MSKFLSILLKGRKSPKEVVALLLAVAIFLSAFVSMPLSFFAFADDSVPYVRVNPGAYSSVHYVSPGTDATAMTNKGYYKITFSVKMLTGNPTFSIQANTGSGYKDINEYCYNTTTYPFLREEYYDENGISKLSYSFRTNTKITDYKIIFGSYDYDDNTNSTIIVAKPEMHRYTNKNYNVLHTSDPGNMLPEFSTDSIYYPMEQSNTSNADGKWNFRYLAGKASTVIFGTMTNAEYVAAFSAPKYMLRFYKGGVNDYAEYVDNTINLAAGNYTLKYKYKDFGTTPTLSFAYSTDGGSTYTEKSHLDSTGDGAGNYTLAFTLTEPANAIKINVGNPTDDAGVNLAFADPVLSLEGSDEQLLASINSENINNPGTGENKKWNIYAVADNVQAIETIDVASVSEDYFKPDTATKKIYENVAGKNWARLYYTDYACKVSANKNYIVTADFKLNAGDMNNSLIGSGDDPAFRVSLGGTTLSLANADKFNGITPEFDELNGKIKIAFSPKTDLTGASITIGSYVENSVGSCAVANFSLCEFITKADGTIVYKDSLVKDITDESLNIGDGKSANAKNGMWNTIYLSKQSEHIISDYSADYFKPTPGMLEIKDNAAGAYISYVDDTTVLSAGSKYRLQYKMKAISGTPETSFAAKQIGGVEGAAYSEISASANFISDYNEEFDDITFQKTITFTPNKNIQKLRLLLGSVPPASACALAFADASLYKLSGDTEIGDNLITSIIRPAVVRNSSVQKCWNLVSTNESDISIIVPKIKGTFSTEKMIKITTGDTYNRARYLDSSFTFMSGKTYMFTVDYVVYSGSPDITVANVKSKSSSYEVIDSVEDARKTIKFTIDSGKTVSGLEITLGNGSEAKNVSAVFANPELYMLDDSGNPTGNNLVNPVTEETSKMMGDWDNGGIWNLRHATEKMKSIELIDMDESYFRSLSTLSIDGGNGNIAQTVTVKPSTYYRLSYLVKDNGTSKVVPYIKAILPGGTTEDLAYNNVIENANGYYNFSCEFQTPASLAGTNNLRVGIAFDSAVTASVTNVELYEYNKGFEPTGVSLIADGDFSAQVSIPAYTSPADAGWTYEGTLGTVNISLRSPNMFKILVPQMFIFVGGSNNNYIGQTATLQTGKTYNLSFNLKYANPGYEGETGVDLLYCATVQDTDENGNPLFNSDSSPKMVDKWETLPATDNSPATEYKKSYNFTLPSNARDDSNMQFRVKNGSEYVSGYLADAKLVDTSDTTVNILENGDFKKGTQGWTVNGSIARTFLTEIPDGYFTNPQSNKPYMIVYRNASSWENFHQSYLNLKPDSYYKLVAKSVHPWELIDTSVYSVQVFEYDENGKKKADPFIGSNLGKCPNCCSASNVNYTIFESSTVKDQYGKDVKVYICEKCKTTYDEKTFKESILVEHENGNLIKAYHTPKILGTNGNAYFRIVMQGGGNAGYWGEMALYECDVNGNILSDNILINGDLSLGLTGWEIEPTDDFVYRIVEQPANFFETYQKADDNMIISEGTAQNATIGQTIAVERGTTYYFSGFYVNMNLAGITPKIMYYNTNGEYVEAPVEFIYDSNRFFFEGKFTLPDDANSLRGKTTVDFLLTNGAGGKAYISTLGVYKEGKYVNLLQNSNFKNGFTGWNVSAANYTIAPYDASVFVFHYDDDAFDDGDWSGTATMSLLGNGEITGRIVDGEGNPMKGIKVILKPGNMTATTDEEGIYKFINLKPGEYSLYIVTPAGEEVFIKQVTVESGMQHYVSDITLELLEDESLDSAEFNTGYDFGVVCGYLFDSDGNPLKGQKLYLGKVGSVTTKKKGVFQFNEVPPGKYDIFTELEDGSVHIFRRVKVAAGKGSIYKLRMPGKSGLGVWWIVLICAGGVLVLGGGAVLVIILIKKKKKVITV